MDDLVDELEENITYEDLYKLHTGHRLFQHSDDSDTSSESSISRYEHLKPPPYSYAELTENLVVVEKSVKRESKTGWKIVSTNSSYLNNCHSMIQSTEPTTVKDLLIFELTECKQTPETPKCKQTLTPSEKVAEKLSQLITEEHCLICDNRNKTHYRQYGHYKNTMKWLETQLKVIQQPVKMELLFCHICNLPLSGNEKAKIHYQEKFHNEKAKSFCVPCLRFIEAVDMPSHRTSKKHLANVELASFSVSELKKSENQSSATTNDSLQEKKEYRIPNLSKPSKDLVKEYDQYSAPTYESFQDRKENQIPNLSKPSQDANKQNENLSRSYASVLKETLSIKSVLSDCKREDVKQFEPLKCHITEKSNRAEKDTQRILTAESLTPDSIYDDTGSPEEQDLLRMCNPFAIMLMKRLRRNYCYICSEPVHREKGFHYKKKQHYETLKEWIERYGLLFGYTSRTVRSVICFPCHCIFPTFIVANQHYTSIEHEKNAKYYCDICMVHDNSDSHKKHKNKLALPPEHQDQISTEQKLNIEEITQTKKQNVETKASDFEINNCGSESTNNFKENIISKVESFPKRDVRLKEKESITKLSKLSEEVSKDAKSTKCTKENITSNVKPIPKRDIILKEEESITKLSKLPAKVSKDAESRECTNSNVEPIPKRYFILKEEESITKLSKLPAKVSKDAESRKCTNSNVEPIPKRDFILKEEERITKLSKLPAKVSKDAESRKCTNSNVEPIPKRELILKEEESIKKLSKLPEKVSRGSESRKCTKENITSNVEPSPKRDIRLKEEESITKLLPYKVSKDVVKDSKDDHNYIKKGEENKTYHLTKNKTPILLDERSEGKLSVAEECANMNEIGSTLDSKPIKSDITISTLGLGLNKSSVKNITSTNKEHVEQCETIFADYRQLTAKLETLPLEICSIYIRKFNREIEDIYKENTHILDDRNIKNGVTSMNTTRQNEPRETTKRTNFSLPFQPTLKTILKYAFNCLTRNSQLSFLICFCYCFVYTFLCLFEHIF